MNEPNFFQEYRLALRQELMALLNQPQPIYTMLRYHMGWCDEQGQPSSAEGKMVRGILCLASAKAAGVDYQQALPVAAAVEIIHGFSLIHDDIEDISPLRRQRPTVWKIWGQPQAINAGDAMLVLAHLALLKLPGRNIPPEKVIHAATILDTACLELCLGQQEDLSFENRLDISIDAYIDMISHKTAALFKASLLLGAILGTEDERFICGFGSFGQKLGLAFQLQDDKMGIWGDEKYTGKPATSDIYQRKKSLPIIYAIQKSMGEERQELECIYQQCGLNSQDEARVRQILYNVGAERYTQDIAERYFHEANYELESIGLPLESIKELKETVPFLLRRQS